MRNGYLRNIIYTFLLFLPIIYANAQPITPDEFDNTDEWHVYKSDGVEAEISQADGLTDKAIRFDYNFTKGTGYAGFQKNFHIDLPENYQFTFYVKAESPDNNFEFKLIDSTGQNVWWVNNVNYKFPVKWTKIKIKKRHINFAWGPTEDKSLKKIDRIEFTIASYVGGKGSVYIDELNFEPLPPEDNSPIIPEVYASSESNLPNGQAGKDFSIINITDNNLNTEWKSNEGESQNIVLDLKRRSEFGGIVINWDKEDYAKDFDVYLSQDNKGWEKVCSIRDARGINNYIRLKEEDALGIKIELLKSSRGNGYGINEISINNVDYSADINKFFINIAKDYPRGYFPRYLSEEASFWTVVGVNNDVKEAMINEDGMVEVDKKNFSIEPFLSTDGKFITWNDVKQKQSLQENYLPISKVTWDYNDLILETKIFAEGEANKNSVLYLIYKLKNNSSVRNEGSLYLAIRPFQVNPYYQTLNITGGAGKINSIEKKNERIYVNNERTIVPVSTYDTFGACIFDEDHIGDFIRRGYIPSNKSIIDPVNLASGVLSYNYNLKPGEEKTIYLAVPFYGGETISENLDREKVEQKLKETIDFWESQVNHIKFNLPESANKIVNTYKSNLAYILINRDKAGIQPGSRSYERSWIRDGALTSSALLKSGIKQEVKEFIDWYSAHQYENGKIPCVVDSRGPDPVPENDSHGEFIYLIKEYYNFTKDTSILRKMNENVLMAVKYMESLIAERSTDHFKNGNDSVRAYYGLMPESISHEGYSAKPMHSYWDDFFTMKGLKDAAEIERILGEEDSYKKIKILRDTFKKNLYNSLKLAMKTRHIDYIPGCVELGDFDATSTTIAISPCNELHNLPQPYIENTFDKYFEFFKDRRDNKIDWTAYTPYEIRLIGSFIILDQPERAHELIKFFLDDQRPRGWNHWAEVVWNDERYPGYIGDMPHTWVGSDFINAVRSMFVYESASGGEDHGSLILAAALYQDWIDAPEGMSIENLPTYYGELSYSINKEDEKYLFSIYGSIKLPAKGIKIKNFNGSKLPAKVTVNGKEINSFSEKEIIVNEFPADLVINY